MSTSGLLSLLLLLAFSSLQSSSLPQPDTWEEKTIIAKQILSSMENATLFLEKKWEKLTLGSLVSFRMLGVQLKGVQEIWAMNFQEEPMSKRSGRLSMRVDILFDKSIPYLKQRAPAQIKDFHQTLQPEFWKLPETWTHTNPALIFHKVKSPSSELKHSIKQCIIQLLGTRNKHSEPCSYSKLCKTLMTMPGYSGFYLSDQMLYFLLARMVGCTEGLFSQTQLYIDFFCANMMDLNEGIEASGYNYLMRKLFMQNIMFCGICGFSDFYKLSWLEAILNWQNPEEGCFGKSNGCSLEDTSTAVGTMGGFLYVLANYPNAYRSSFLSPHVYLGKVTPERDLSMLDTQR